MFFSEFCQISKNVYWQSTSGWLLFLWILKSFSEHLFYTAHLRNYLFHVKVAVFQPANTAKNYLTGAIQVFYTKTRSSHSKALIYLKTLKIIYEDVNS